MTHRPFKCEKKKKFGIVSKSTFITLISLIVVVLSFSAAFAYETEPPGDDGIPPGSDNCPTVVNPEQRNNDVIPGAPTYIVMDGSPPTNDPPVDSITATPGTFAKNSLDNGPYTTTNMEMDCNTCLTSSFPTGQTQFGGGTAFCGFSSQVPENLATNQSEFCVYDSTAGEYWDFKFLTHRRWGSCIGDPTACTNAGDYTSYNRTLLVQDADGNACDCGDEGTPGYNPGDGFCTAYQWCVDQATPDPDCGPKVVPDDITDLTATNGETTVTLAWSEPNDNLGPIYGYRVEYGTVASGAFASTCSDPTCTDVTTGATIPGLDNNVTYQFRVFALNDNGESGASNVDTGKASHIRQWPSAGSPGNVEISSSSNRDYSPRGIYTTDGTFIATWIDDNTSLSNDRQLYAQKIDLTTGGTFGTGSWISGGIEISEANGFDNPYSAYESVSDGAGGIITIWSGGSAWNLQDVYVQKLDSNGDRQWFISTPCTHNVNCNNIVVSGGASYMSSVDILEDGSGGAFILWDDYYGSINVSRIDSSGTVLWGPVTSPAFNYKANAELVSDGSGGVIVVFRGRVLSTDNYALFTYKIQGDGTYGTPLNLTDNWPNSGSTIKISDDTYRCNAHQSTSDENGGLYLTCDSYSSPTLSIRAYHVDSDGFIDTGGSWNGSTGFTIYALGGSFDADLTTDGSGNLIYGFSPSGTAYIESLSSTATRHWGNPSPILIYNGAYMIGSNMRKGLAGDGSGGAYITMRSSSNDKIILQHIDDTGTTSFPIAGSTVGYEIGNETAGDVDDAHVIPGASTLILWTKDPGTNNDDIFGQYFKESTNPCDSLGSNEMCGTQSISSSTLTFQDIPDTFNFGTITAGSDQDLFNNETPPDPNQPGADDLLQVYDDRNSGGFTVTVDAEGSFTDGTNTIPLTNLYTVTSLEETPAGGDVNVGGITYKSGFAGDQTVSAPLYVDVDSVDLTTVGTYSTDFSSAPIVLMNGTLGSGSGRVGAMTLFTNYYLHIAASQLDGNYALVLTYTLADATT